MKAILFFWSVGVSLGALAGSWIWYPGDAAVSLAERTQRLRFERGGTIPPMSPQSVHTPVVAFRSTFTNAEPEKVVVEADGQALLVVPGLYPTPFSGRFECTLPAGPCDVWVRVMNYERVPSLRVTGRRVNTSADWETTPNSDLWERCETGPMGAGDEPPGAFRLATRPMAPVARETVGSGLLVDFGREAMGFVRLRGIAGNGRVKVVYGESRDEALGADADIDAYEFADVREGTDFRFPVSRAFRYVHVRCPKGVSVREVTADEEYLPVECRGAFRCDDERLNRIWDVSVRTLHLTAREFFLDGIKRDRWIWGGDACQSFLMNYYAFADPDIVRRTLLALRGRDPVLAHVNCIPGYTLYWFSSVADYYLYTGDADFVRALYPKMRSLMEFVFARNVRSDGFLHDAKGDWVFVDWSEERLENTGGATAFLQILLVRAMEAMAEAASLAGDAAAAADFASKAATLKARIVPSFWDERRGGLIHIVKNDGTRHPQLTRHANMFALLCGCLDASHARRVTDAVLLNDAVTPIQTPYMRFYELESLCRLGRQEHVLKEIRSYWGGMLDLGATSFWELYNPKERGRAHYAMYNRPFGRSLCHSWGASPVYLLGRYVLGVAPTSPGFKTYTVAPAPGGLRRLSGKVPTPKGCVSVSLEGDRLVVRGAPDGTGTVTWKGRSKTLPPGASVTFP